MEPTLRSPPRSVVRKSHDSRDGEQQADCEHGSAPDAEAPLLGCCHGVEAIPARWLNAFRERERIEQVAEALGNAA
jgi:hypothetical protein